MELLILLGIFVGVLLAMYLIGVPVAVAMGATCIVVMVLPIGPGFSLGTISNQLLEGLNTFTMLAVPFYLMLGRIMNRSGMTSVIFEFANDLVGHFRSGIAQVNIIASLIFSGMSGLAVADAAGLGRVEYTAMREHGYDKETSLGVTGVSSIIGPIMPPSVPVILYGVIAEESISDLFLAGVIPALLLTAILSAFVYVVVRIKGIGRGDPFNLRACMNSFVNALPALFIPILVIGGILGGLFTATEAGAIALIYAIILSFANGTLNFGGLIQEFQEGMVETFSILFIIAIAMLYGLMALQLRLPMILADTITGLSTDPTVITALLAISMLVIGTFMSITATILVATPILVPIMPVVGIDPVHFGIVMILSLMLGVVTPPLGVVLFVLEKVTDASLGTVMKAVIPFYIPVLIVIALLIIFPEIVLFLPGL